MERLKQGVRDFRAKVFPRQKALMEGLARDGQKPHTLVIACSDSRIKVSEWTQADPGEFFFVRNAGNIVPPPGSPANGAAASIEYAVRNLPIRNVIVAGHSHCGAVSALFTPEVLEELPEVKAWLQNALEARPRAESKYPNVKGDDRIALAVGENVLLQLEHLREYPCIQDGLKEGKLELYAWVFEFESGTTWEHNTQTGKWMPIE